MQASLPASLPASPLRKRPRETSCEHAATAVFQDDEQIRRVQRGERPFDEATFIEQFLCESPVRQTTKSPAKRKQESPLTRGVERSPRARLLVAAYMASSGPTPPSPLKAMDDLLESDAIRSWALHNVAGVVERRSVHRLARVQLDAQRGGRDSSLTWKYEGDRMSGAWCDGVWFSAEEIQTFVS